MGTTAGIQTKQAHGLRLILGRSNVARAPRGMGLPGLDLHLPKGDRTGTWAVSVSGNWHITFALSGRDVVNVDYEDYR
ncbi:type II toxin-antitoxin system RelE/ParE family toxin [Candidatus Methylomirabilis sp.]|uniref:type II toxin-antitoxin system RelE/ParE family toxin n=1 Tax=Candidatus Methylomirabilis sp. TaxID=2032687 RepID=UPI00307627A6